MKHLEYFNHWYDKILNSFPFLLDDSEIKTIGIAWIFRENNHWNVTPRITGDAQYYNAMFFIRTNLSAVLLGIFMYLLAPILSWYLWALVFFDCGT